MFNPLIHRGNKQSHVLKGTVMQMEKVLINDRLRVLNVS